MFFCFNCFKANTMYQSISSLFVGGHVHIGQTEGNIESWCLVLRWQVSTRSGDAQCCTIKWDTKQIQQQQIKQLGGREWHGSGTTKIYRILGFLDCLNGARMPGSSLLHWKTLTACFAVSLFTFGCYVRCGIRGEMRTQRHVLDCAPFPFLLYWFAQGSLHHYRIAEAVEGRMLILSNESTFCARVTRWKGMRTVRTEAVAGLAYRFWSVFPPCSNPQKWYKQP